MVVGLAIAKAVKTILINCCIMLCCNARHLQAHDGLRIFKFALRLLDMVSKITYLQKVYNDSRE